MARVLTHDLEPPNLLCPTIASDASLVIRARVLCVQRRVVLNRYLSLLPLLIDYQRAVLPDQIPLFLIVCRRLARDDCMFANSLVLSPDGLLIDQLFRVWVAGVLHVKCTTSEFGPVERRRLLGSMVAETNGDHLATVCRTEVERVGFLRVAALELLELHDLNNGLAHCSKHRGEGIGLLPGFPCTMVCQVGHVQGGRMLAVGRAKDVAICIKGHQVCHIPTNRGEIGDHAIVHESMSTKDKGVGIHLGHSTAAACSDVRQYAVGLGIFAKGPEVEVVYGGRL